MERATPASTSGAWFWMAVIGFHSITLAVITYAVSLSGDNAKDLPIAHLLLGTGLLLLAPAASRAFRRRKTETSDAHQCNGTLP